MKHILILGGDGYLGWPTAMYFSSKGYEVTVADNYLRRSESKRLNCFPLYEIPDLEERSKIWYEKTGYEIKVIIGDLTSPDIMRNIFNGKVRYNWAIDKNFSGLPQTVVHYAEQPSAPYSMIDYVHSNFTLQNNLLVTNNLMYSVRDLSPETHIIKLGSMGEYGTPNIDIEEGWIDIEHKGRKAKFLYPRQGGSIYHTTKIMDTDLLWFGVRMWNLKVTDLMQGPVYGIETEESKIDSRLRTLFNYDEIYGTVINRFITEAVTGYPLTVYGKGGQTRGFLNIKDTLQCIHKAEISPALPGELRIFNQFMETLSVNEIAEKVKSVGNKLGLNVAIKSVINPRKESEEHYYNPIHRGLLNLGVEPHYLTDDVLTEMFRVVEEYKDRVNKDIIIKNIRW